MELTVDSVKMPAIRPAETVLVGYVAWALVRMAIAGRFAVHFGLLPGPDLLLVFVSIVTARLVAEALRSPLPAAARTIHRVLVPVAIGAAIVGLAIVGLESWRDYGDAHSTSTWFLFLREQTSRIGLAVVLPAFAWLVVGRRLRATPEPAAALAPLPLAREGLAVVGGAARDWLALVLTIYAYSSTEASGAMSGDADDALKHVDRAMFLGHDPNVLLERIISPALSEWMAGCYVFYLFLFPIALGVVYAVDAPRFRWFAFSVVLTLALGYVGYALVPARGPVFTTHFDVSLDLYYLQPVTEQLMDHMRVPRDCFPSLHTAASLTLLRGTYKSAPRLAIVLAPIVLTIPIACVYLRYHYVVDVLAGLALFVVVAKITDALSGGVVRTADGAPSVSETRAHVE